MQKKGGTNMQITADIIMASAITATLLSSYSFLFLRLFLALGHTAFILSIFSSLEWGSSLAAGVGVVSFLLLESIWEKDCGLLILLIILAVIGMFYFLGVSISAPSLSSIFWQIRLF